MYPRVDGKKTSSPATAPPISGVDSKISPVSRLDFLPGRWPRASIPIRHELEGGPQVSAFPCTPKAALRQNLNWVLAKIRLQPLFTHSSSFTMLQLDLYIWKLGDSKAWSLNETFSCMGNNREEALRAGGAKSSGRTLFAKDSLVDGVHVTEIISIFTAHFWKHCKQLIHTTATGNKKSAFFSYYEWQ